MRKKLFALLVGILAVTLLLTACAGVNLTLTFEVDGEAFATVNTSGQEAVQMPKDPVKEGYLFDGWYWDKDVWEKPFTVNSLLETPLTESMTVYAKWKEVEEEHDHSYGEWTVTTAATCTTEGLEKRVCECGEEETRAIAKLAHTYEEKYDEVNHWKECSLCKDKIDKAAHVYENNVCTVCGFTQGTEGLTYRKISGGYEVSGIGTAEGNSIKIASIHEGEPVIGIGSYAFSKCSSLVSVVIPSSVTSIDYYAFYNCSSLVSIVIPEGVTSIGSSAFSSCSNLVSIVIPDSVTSIGYSAFRDCSSLVSVEIPSSVTSIGSYAFYYCSSLISIVIPEGVTSIGSYAFYNCISLVSIEIPSSVTSIGSYAFERCISLESIEIPSSVTSIGYEAFRDCSSLVSVIIPSSVTSIGDYAFGGCSSLVSVIIPSSVTSIGYRAFSSCSSLVSIVIPEGVTSIGDYAFSFCGSLVSIEYSGTKAEWKAIKKGSWWNSNTGNYTVTCTDGKLTKADS